MNSWFVLFVFYLGYNPVVEPLPGVFRVLSLISSTRVRVGLTSMTIENKFSFSSLLCFDIQYI